MKRAALGIALAALVFAAASAWAPAYFYEAPILMYHKVEPAQDGRADSTRVSPAIFEKQMEFLKVRGYRVVPLAQLARDVAAGKRLPDKTVAITFDDGTLDNFRYAFPVLRKMKFPATIFMITDNIGREGWLSEEDLRILDESGITIGSHTVRHTFLPEADEATVRRELADSKTRLEQILGRPVTLFSYPAGGVTPGIQRLVAEAGYEVAVTTNYHRDRRDILALHRVKATESGGSLFSFWVKTSGYYHLGKKRIVRGDALGGAPYGN